MEYALFIFILIILYLAREAELLRVAGHPSLARRIVIYGLNIGLAVLVGTALSQSFDSGSYLWRIRQPDVVKPLLSMQLAIWFYYVWLHRTGNVKYMWTVAVVPSPVLVLCLVGITVAVKGYITTDAGYAEALGVIAIWVAGVALWTRWTDLASEFDPVWRSGFVAISNALIVVLVPFENIFAGAKNLVQMMFAHD